MPPSSIVRHVPNGKPAFETSSEVAEATTSRARGPQIPAVHHVEVASNSCAEPSAGRWSRNHLRSPIPWAPPVTTRNWSRPSRMIVRSDLIPPASLSSGV